MKKIIYFDCFSGISGDMVLGALLDAEVSGVDISFLKKELEKLNIAGYEIESEKVKKSEIGATQFKVIIKEEQPCRAYSDIINLIKKSTINTEAKKNALAVFEIIASAESKIHQNRINEVHFHEVGAVDSIIDIVGTAIFMAELKIDEVYCSNIPTGSGFIKTAHGMFPVPAPATLEILKGIPVYCGNFNFEVTTPTGAAIIKHYAKDYGNIPLMIINNTGFGSGSNKGKDIPNLLRIIFGRLCESDDINKKDLSKNKDINYENLIQFCANIDDVSAEIIGYLMEKLFEETVLDAWTEPIYMKKNRQAVKINVLCKPEDEMKICNILFSETSTLGIRRQVIQRYSLSREIATLKLPYGEINIKVGYKNGKAITYSPEYESCKVLAQKTGKPIKDIYRDASCFFSIK